MKNKKGKKSSMYHIKKINIYGTRSPVITPYHPYVPAAMVNTRLGNMNTAPTRLRRKRMQIPWIISMPLSQVRKLKITFVLMWSQRSKRDKRVIPATATTERRNLYFSTR